ncbi:microtubule-associated proteins 1A/1B light chain 3C-like [Plodia interpunctella]|uniref:microtubule-associated proteins 1A/1B light chain 3C-like n=1 Tax=Plodia interpunctella TaxID=58824 RepID=UPI002367AECD|nr:microtubule-associated proteins 1A/1B light chain 3C-like [Plodia interpunctella]
MELNFITTLIKHDVNHNVKQCFKSKKPFVSRKEEVMAIKSKFPTKIPLIVERYHKERNLPTLDKTKFLVPEDITMSQFLVIIRNRIRIKPNQALYLIINNRSMLSMSLTMAQAYENYGDEDGFLYITYASQEVFGYKDDIGGSDNEAQAIRHRFPNKVPLYVQRFVREREVPALGRNKFLVPQELTMSQFLYIIRSKMKLRDSQALYLLVNDKVLASHSMTMEQAYQLFRSDDGYLHITYAAQQVFG